MMETLKQKGGRLLESLADYVELSLRLFALQSADKSARLASGFLTIVVLTLVFIFSLIMLSIGAAILISFLLHRAWIGFVILGAFYLLVGIILIVVRKKIISTPILNLIIPALVTAELKAEENIEKAQDKIEDKLHLEKQPD